MIKCVTFDWGDTLATNWGMPYLATEKRCLKRLAEDLRAQGGHPPQGWEQTCLDQLQSVWWGTADRAKNPDNREMDFAGLFRSWVAATGLDHDDARLTPALERAWATMTDTVIPYAESLPTLKALKERGLRVGILSHVPWIGSACRSWYRRHGLAPYVDFYSLSCDVGFIKPHPAHYQDAIRQAGVAPGEILHVGDHPWRDVEGGRSFGLHTCLRRTERIYAEETLDACQPDAEILHLGEVLDLIDRW